MKRWLYAKRFVFDATRAADVRVAAIWIRGQMETVDVIFDDSPFGIERADDQ